MSGKRRRLDAVGMEVGHADALIVAAAHADRRIRIAFGTGEEFFGGCEEFPSGVGIAAENLLEVAAPFVGRLPRHALDEPAGRASVRFTVRTARAIYADGSGLAELRDGSSPLAPLWGAFSALMTPMIVVLFKGPTSTDRAARWMPGLARARRLWLRR